jgi:hypothetical protein
MFVHGVARKDITSELAILDSKRVKNNDEPA